MLVWIGHRAAREVFPVPTFFTLGIPALIAFAPVQAFYSIQNDVLSPLCFGMAFICLLRVWRAESSRPRAGRGHRIGHGGNVSDEIEQRAIAGSCRNFHPLKNHQAGKNRNPSATHCPPVTRLGFAALPGIAWLAWLKIAFGDFSGSAAKLRFITWTLKPFAEWWHHPIFTL